MTRIGLQICKQTLRWVGGKIVSSVGQVKFKNGTLLSDEKCILCRLEEEGVKWLSRVIKVVR